MNRNLASCWTSLVVLVFGAMIASGCSPAAAPDAGAGGEPSAGGVVAAASAPAPLEPGYALHPDDALEKLLARAGGECKVIAPVGRPEDCAALDRDIDARIRSLGVASLDTLVPAVVDEDPTRSMLGVWYLGANFPRAIVIKVARDPKLITEAQVDYLLGAASQLKTQDRGAHRVARVAVSLATIKGMFDKARAFIEASPDADVRAASVGVSMHYGRLALFDVVQKYGASAEVRDRAAAFQAAHTMPAWTPEEEAKLCPWLGGFLGDTEEVTTQTVTSGLLRCGGEWSGKVIEEAKQRVEAGTWTRGFGLAVREPCQGAALARGEERVAVCDQVRGVLQAVVESDKLPVAERAAAIDSFAAFWPNAETLELVRGYSALSDPKLQEHAKGAATAIEQRMKQPKVQ